MSVRFSIVIPVFNAEKTIERCVKSVLLQNYTDYEVILVNDGSTDKTGKILNNFLKTSEKLILKEQNNRGPGLARNAGIERASGEYIIFVDSDDYIDEGYFEALDNIIKLENSDVIVIDAVQEKIDGKIICKEKISKFANYSKKLLIRCQMTGKIPWGGWRKVTRRSIIINNKIFYSDDEVGEEAIFSFECLRNARKISFLNSEYYHYVNYPSSQSKKGNDDPWGPVYLRMKNYLIENLLFEEYQKTIQSFSVTALTASLYRLASINTFEETKEKLREKVKDLEKNCKVSVDWRSLNKANKFLYPFYMLHLYNVLVLLAKGYCNLNKYEKNKNFSS